MNEIEPTLFATPTTIQAVERTHSVAVLVGGYDGSGNFGDIVLLDAALGVIDRLGSAFIALPILERRLLRNHRELSSDSGLDPPHPLFIAPGEDLDDDLMPLPAPTELAFGAIYLYGGGYLNRDWGARKLAMVRSAERFLTSPGVRQICRVSTGLQAEAAWIAGLGEEDRSTLGRFDSLGARDSQSRETLGAIGATVPAVETGDDAIGPLSLLPRSGPPALDGGPLVVNVHFADHGWVSEHPQTLLSFYTGLLGELGRVTNQRLVARPLISYLDGRVNERLAIDRLRDACSGLDAEFAEPLVLRPSVLPEAAPELSEASLTISCSYHVALTSLMLGVPAFLLGDSPYYAQKAAGLAEDFGLPPAFTVSTETDSLACAREIADCLLDGEGGNAVQRQLGATADRLQRRRIGIEADLLARLSSAALLALAERLDEMADSLHERSTEPADLRSRLSALQTELEELRHRAEEAPTPLEAELRAQEAELNSAEAHAALATVLQSRSWRMTEPLRRTGARMRRWVPKR